MKLEVQNIIYQGFEITLTSSMDAITDSFSITSPNRWIDSEELLVNDTCSILNSDGDAQLTGYITDLSPQIGGKIGIQGYDKTIDLVDSVISGTGEFIGMTLKQIITSICSPFDISVSGEDGSTISTYRYGINISAASVIRDLVTRQGYLARSDGDGNIVLETVTTTSKSTFICQEGVNIISGTANISGRAQQSEYAIYGQSSTSNTVKSTFDGQSPRYRPYAGINTGSLQIADAESSAEWKGRISESNAVSYRIEVADIQPVTKNMLIDVYSPTLGVDGELLIRSVKKVISGEFSRTIMELTAPYAFGGEYVDNAWLK